MKSKPLLEKEKKIYKLPFYDDTMKDFNKLVKLGQQIINKRKLGD